MKPPDLTINSLRPTLPDQIPISVHARSRNPLPSYLNDNEIFNPNQHPFPQNPLSDRVQSTPTLYYPSPSPQFINGNDYPTPYHQHYVPHVPVQEKLLSSRKYINPSFPMSGCSTGTPSPEFPYQLVSGQPPSLQHLHQPQQHQHLPHQQLQQFRKSQDNLSNDDSGYISAKVSEIHGPAVGASNGSHSPMQPMEVIPMPRQFIPYSMANTAAMLEGAVGGIGTGPGSTTNMYDEQPHYNLGASSLV